MDIRVHMAMNTIYNHAGVSLYHGDGAAVVSAAGLEGMVDLIVTSPPYDDIRAYGGHSFDFPTMAKACESALAPGGVLVWIVGDSVDERGVKPVRRFGRRSTSWIWECYFMTL